MTSTEKALAWLLQSSADPNKLSLTIRGLLLGSVPTLMFLLGLAHVDLGQDQLTAFFDAIVNLITAGLALVSAAATLYGFCRKVYLTIIGSTV